MTYQPDPYHDAGHRPRINDNRKREHQKEVMPVDYTRNHHSDLNSPANVPSGGGAIAEHVEMMRTLASRIRQEATHWRTSLRGFREENEATARQLSKEAAAIEAILKEWDELLKDKARLDWLEKEETVEMYRGVASTKVLTNYGNEAFRTAEEMSCRAAIDAAMEKDSQK